MNKQIKIIFAILLVGLIIIPQNTKGLFGVEVNHQTAYRISKASYDVTVDTAAEVFSGFLVDGDIIAENTVMVINVESIDPTELTWNSTVNNKTTTGICSDAFDSMAFTEFVLSAQYLLQTWDMSTIISSGVIPPEYLDAFYLPLFVSIAPITWTSMEQISLDMGSYLDSTYGMIGIVLDVNEGNWTETSEVASFEYWYQFNYTISPSPPSYIEMNSITNFKYDKTTGSLLEAEIDLDMQGYWGGYPFVILVDYFVEQTRLPFNFLEFLTENMWYFVGGGAGLVVIAIIAIVFKLRAK